MLMFEPPQSHKLFVDQFPIVWKVITFRAKGHAKATITYVNRLGFGYGEIDSNNSVDSAAWVEVKSGEIVTLTGGPNQMEFGQVSKGSDTKSLVCKNETNHRVNLSIGIIKGNDITQRYEPTMVWAGVGSKSNVTTRFTPILTAYVTSDYQATEVLRGEVETDAIWSQNLNEIDDVTGWRFSEDDASGAFSIEPASRV